MNEQELRKMLHGIFSKKGGLSSKLDECVRNLAPLLSFTSDTQKKVARLRDELAGIEAELHEKLDTENQLANDLQEAVEALSRLQ